jgi:RNA polymerase sigma-70 factor (ECF subfamily)
MCAYRIVHLSAIATNRSCVSCGVDLEKLVREHQPMVFSLAYHFLRDRARAEDLAQDVFLHLHQKLHELESPDHVRFWLRRVTAHRCIDESRRAKWRNGPGLDQLPEPRVSAHESDFLRDEVLRKLVASLPEKARLVVILRYQEDLEPTEIAEIVGLPLGTVKSQLHRALAVLRRKLQRTDQKVAL